MGIALEIRGVRKGYPGFLLNDINLEVPAGYVMGLVGPNGAGKTTLIKLILDLVRRDGGQIRVLGHDPAVDGNIKSRVGVVHEVPRYQGHLSLRDIRSVIAPFYPSWDEAVFRRLMGAFELPLRQRFGRLSRGMKTRFALALALSHRAEMLLLDEPTTGLDPVFRRRLLDVIREELKGETTTVLFSTHITSDLDDLADYVTVLIGGRVMLSQRMDELAESWGVVCGSPEALPSLQGLLRGVRETSVGFDAVTDSVSQVRREGGETVIVERATVEDILVHLARDEEISKGRSIVEHRTSNAERRFEVGGSNLEHAGSESQTSSSPGETP